MAATVVPHESSPAQVLRISYDAARGAYAARVDVRRGGAVYRYPCEIPGPEGADPAWISAALAARALAMSDSRPS
jgi:hypothetical protein